MHLADLMSLASTFSVLAVTAALALLFLLLVPRSGRGSFLPNKTSLVGPEQTRQKLHELPTVERAPLSRIVRTGVSRILLVLGLLLVLLSGSFASGWVYGMTIGEREGTRAVVIQADLPWQNAGIGVVAGQKISITAFGRWNNGPDGADYGPGGNGKEGAGLVAPSSPTGALVGRIGESIPFTIGEGANVTATASGQLRLAMDDWPDSYSDNHGMMTVLITVQDR